jgi:hypothetical protein
MFLLGEYDRELYEEAYNDFPTARLFRLKRRPATASPR